MFTNPSPFDSLRLNIFMRKHIDLTDTWRQENVSHFYTHLLFIESGSAYLRDNGHTLPMEAGMVYLIPSRYRFSYGCNEPHKQLGFLLRLETTPKVDILSGFGKICSMPYDPESYRALLSAFHSENHLDHIRMHSMLLHMIFQIAQANSIQLNPVPTPSKHIKNAISYISSNLSASLTVTQICKALWISESKLRNDFKKQLHIPIGKYIEQRLFQEAKKLLENPSIPIGQISQHLEFCDHSYFSGRFKELFGCTPSQFRKSQK